MIGVYFKGRLGNQLFQYVFFRYLKETNKNKLVFFENPHHAYLTKYFDLLDNDNFTIGSKLYSAVTRVVPVLLRFKKIFIQNFVTPREIKAKNFTVYHGYFQTDFYLNLLRQKPVFQIKQTFKDDFLKQYGDIFNNEKTIAVHIRRTDYLNYGKRDISLPIEYFKDRIADIEDIGRFKVFFVSDDIAYAKATFGEKENFIFSENSEIIDFQIIQHADIAIISNSSFGWWAAYLGKKDKVVYAPKNWMGFRIGAEHPKSVMTGRFIWKDVFQSVNNTLSNHLSIE